MTSSTVVSCPGKVLLAGGYLVLEPEHPGLVVGTASRFYTSIQGQPPLAKSTDTRFFTVISPQFKNAVWEYQLNYLAKDALQMFQIMTIDSPNKFIQLALEAALKVSYALGNRIEEDLYIDIVGDNDFYSQDRTASTSSSVTDMAGEPEPFAYLKTTLSEVHKTGLGSSAAMVTSLVAAIFVHSSKSSTSPNQSSIPSLSEDTLRLIHNTAQYAHSRAQGKVGSGFDVSAAIWGSQIYRRFSPDCLAALLEPDSLSPDQLLNGLSPSSDLWKPSATTSGDVSPFSLPPCTTLLLADVDAGSNTPSMVGIVLQWREAAGAEGDNLWASIAQANKTLAEVFKSLSEASLKDAEGYTEAVAELAQEPSSQWSDSGASATKQLFCNVRDSIKAIRSRIKKMGELADVPIEPDEQTRLLDACSESVNGVIGGGVPGAGGYDAIWILVLSPAGLQGEPSKAEEGVRELWLGWKEMSVRPLSRKARIQQGPPATRSEVTAGNGLNLHKLEDVQGLAKVVRRMLR